MKRTEKESAVSPVVGVMLMLVVTIIIAAVVAAFAGGLVGTTEKTPNAVLDVHLYKQMKTSMGTFPEFTIDHLSGETIDTSKLKLTFSWTNATGVKKFNEYRYSDSDSISYKVATWSGWTVTGVDDAQTKATLYLNDASKYYSAESADTYFGVTTLSTGSHMQTVNNQMSGYNTSGSAITNLGSPFMDKLFRSSTSDIPATTWKDGADGVGYSEGIMTDLPIGTAVEVSIIYIPSGNAIFNKVVYVQ